MAARPGLAGHPLRWAWWGRRHIPKTGAAGAGGGCSSGRATLWRGSQLEAPRAESQAHPPSAPLHQGHPVARAVKRDSLLPTVATTNSPQGPARSRHVQISELSCPRDSFCPTPILRTTWPRTSPAALGNSKSVLLLLKVYTKRGRGFALCRVGTQSNLGVATVLGIKVEWPISVASGTSVCILKSEP